jgi:hypothetical protein
MRRRGIPTTRSDCAERMGGGDGEFLESASAGGSLYPIDHPISLGNETTVDSLHRVQR